jgi:formiminoglutamase
MQTFPVLLSIPHGGTSVPVELQGRVCLDRHGIHDDIDPFVREIYDLGERVVEVISTDIARTFVDLNRAPDDVPPGNPDGVVKTLTCMSQPIFTSGQELDAGLTAALLDKYYLPYHSRVRHAVQRPGLVLGIDCHSMLAVGPDIGPDTGHTRPMICVGNVRGQACPTDMAEYFADCLRRAFALDQHEVTLNQPFAGGYITRTYGGNPIPWLQIELSRALYLDPRWFARQTLRMEPSRLWELNAQFAAALERFFASS